MTNYSPQPLYSPSVKSAPSILRITPSVVTRWVPNLAIWGIGAVFGLTVFASSIPRYQRDVLAYLPVRN